MNTAKSKYSWTRAIIISLIYAIVASFALVAVSLVSISIPTFAIVKLVALSTCIVVVMVKVMDIV